MGCRSMRTGVRSVAVLTLFVAAASVVVPVAAVPGNGNGPGSNNGNHGNGNNGNGNSGNGNGGNPTGAQVNTVPEPSTLLLAIVALGALVRASRKLPAKPDRSAPALGNIEPQHSERLDLDADSVRRR